MIPLILIAAAAIPLGSIVLDMALDTDGQAPLFLRNRLAVREQEIARLTAPLPPRREEVTPVDFHETWPQRQTPSDLPARLGLVVAEDRPGRHRINETAVGSRAQRQSWATTPTDKFNTLVAETWTDDERHTLSREWWCESCQGDHKDCGGVCACPCTLVGAL